VSLQAPTSLTQTTTATGSLAITWAPVPDARRYEIRIVEEGSTWNDVGESTRWEDTSPPPLELAIRELNASQGTEFRHVSLSANVSFSAAARRYQVRALDALDRPGPESDPITAALTPASISYSWAAGPDATNQSPLIDAAGPEHLDTTAPEVGTPRLYTLTISALGTSASAQATGWRKRPKVAQIVGNSATCALLESGQVRCWGRATMAGHGVMDDISMPAEAGDVELGGEATAIFAGIKHTCAVIKGGVVRCWGVNDARQLGDPLSGEGAVIGDAPGEMPPRSVPLPEPAVMGAAGLRHTCAVGVSGAIYCWGANTASKGELGDTSRGDVKVGTSEAELMALAPVPLPARFKPTAISAGSEHTCALGEEAGAQRLYCWGDNAQGQLGRGDLLYPTAKPPANVEIAPMLKAVAMPSGADTIVTLSAGGYNTCVRAGDRAYCWGANNQGQLGTGDTRSRLAPTSFMPIPDSVREVSAGGTHICALKQATRTVHCWGSGISGQLGTGTNASYGDGTGEATEPPAVKLGTPVARLFSHIVHSCALFEDESLRCWGDNLYQQLGFKDPIKLGDTMENLPDQASYDVQLLKP
jgi:alpha-tubulin suppressor-like RCC1 family protein